MPYDVYRKTAQQLALKNQQQQPQARGSFTVQNKTGAYTPSAPKQVQVQPQPQVPAQGAREGAAPYTYGGTGYAGGAVQDSAAGGRGSMAGMGGYGMGGQNVYDSMARSQAQPSYTKEELEGFGVNFPEMQVIGPTAEDALSAAQANEQWQFSEEGRSSLIDEYMKDVFGEGGSFDPQRELMEEERDAALRRMAEMMASRGMAQSGAMGGMAADIYRGSARDIAQAQQEWRQQEIQNKAQAASMLFQDDWKKMDQDHQKAMAELMYELDRKRQMGEDYNPDFGMAELQLLRDMMNNPELSEAGRAYLEHMLRELYGDQYDEIFGGASWEGEGEIDWTDPSTWWDKLGQWTPGGESGLIEGIGLGLGVPPGLTTVGKTIWDWIF